MRRVLVASWGPDASQYVGRRVELFCDPGVLFGGQAVGGTRISRLSHLDASKKIPLLVSRGKSAMFTVEPLTENTSTLNSPVITPATLADLETMFEAKGIPEAARLTGVNTITGGNATALEVITEAEAQQVLAALAQRPDAGATP